MDDFIEAMIKGHDKTEDIVINNLADQIVTIYKEYSILINNYYTNYFL